MMNMGGKILFERREEERSLGDQIYVENKKKWVLNR
jgi:hypothetical protein